MPTKYPDPLGPVPRVGLGGKHEEIRAGPSTNFQFRRLPVRSLNPTSVTHLGALGDVEGKTALYQEQGQLHRQTINVTHRSLDSNRETGVVRSPTHATNPMAPQEALAGTGDFGQGDSGPPYPPPSSGLVVGGKECTPRPTITSNASRSASFYRRIKRRLGRSLRGLHSKRRLVRTRKSPPYKLLGTKSSLPGSQEFRASLQGSDCPSSHRQHNCGLLHQQGRRYEIRLSLCPPVETSVVVPPQGVILRARHIPGYLNVIADKLSRHNQVIQTEWSLSQQVFRLLFSKWALPQLDLFATRFNHKLPRFVSPVPDPTAWAVDALSLSWENLDVYAFPPLHCSIK